MAKIDNLGAQGEIRDEYSQEEIGKQLDVFTNEHGLKSLRDRLNIGLNEVGILAFEKTQKIIIELCEQVSGTPDKANELYEELTGMCIDIQESGPWDYATELNDPKSEAARLWQMITYTLTREFKKDNGMILKSGNEKELNPKEFFLDLERIIGNLKQAVANPKAFFDEARQAILAGVDRFGVRLESFEKKEKKSGRSEVKMVPVSILKGKEVKSKEWNTSTYVPIADKFEGFMTMAIKGAEAGIVKSDDGEVFVGARGSIDDRLIESCGLIKEERIESGRDGSSRKVTYFRPENTPAGSNNDVVKKVHSGFLVILTRNLDLAKSIVEAIAHKREVVKVAEEALGHTRVIQTSEGERGEDSHILEWEKRAFLRPSAVGVAEGGVKSSETGLERQKDLFYNLLWGIRGRFVYLDALKVLAEKMAEKGQEVSDNDKLELIEKTSEKMRQKVEELVYINEVIGKYLEKMSPDVKRVIDMAGGAGDLGLAVAMEMLVKNKDLDNVEIVDPQAGTDDFMHTIIANMPPGLRIQFEKIAHHALEHGNGYLQNTPITPDAIVVAKHACGTLTDAIISQWKDSESKFLVAMTCCQDKACGHPAPYGFSQEDWDRLTMESGWTNLEDEIERSSGNKKEQLVDKLKKGKKAMEILDMARVNYLRRHGFAAKLITTDRFPKGDVIIARRLPKNFEQKLAGLEKTEKEDLLRFDEALRRLDLLSRGVDVKGMRAEFGEEWGDEDFRELADRFSVKGGEQTEEVQPEVVDPKVELLKREIEVFGMKLSEYVKTLLPKGVGGRELGAAIKSAREIFDESIDKTSEEIKKAVDVMLNIS